MKKCFLIIGILILSFSSCHSLSYIKPKLDIIQTNEKAAIEKAIEAKDKTYVIVENTREIEAVIEKIDIPIETKKEVRARLDNIINATNTIEIKIEDAIEDIEKNEQVIVSIEKDVESGKNSILKCIVIILAAAFILVLFLS
jgi:DNA repair ATPase RecN